MRNLVVHLIILIFINSFDFLQFQNFCLSHVLTYIIHIPGVKHLRDEWETMGVPELWES